MNGIRSIWTACMILWLAQEGFSQKWAIHLNVNELYPLDASYGSGRTIYPVLWYQQQEPNFLVGGFGVGVSRSQSWTKHQSWKIQGNLSRFRIFEPNSILTDPSGNIVSFFRLPATFYNINTLGLYQLQAGKWTFGTGLGLRFVAYGHTKNITVTDEKNNTEKIRLSNKSSTPASFFLPLEIGVELGKQVRLAIRGEYMLTPLSRLYKKEKYLLLNTELSYTFGETNTEE